MLQLNPVCNTFKNKYVKTNLTTKIPKNVTKRTDFVSPAPLKLQILSYSLLRKVDMYQPFLMPV